MIEACKQNPQQTEKGSHRRWAGQYRKERRRVRIRRRTGHFERERDQEREEFDYSMFSARSRAGMHVLQMIKAHARAVSRERKKYIKLEDNFDELWQEHSDLSIKYNGMSAKRDKENSEKLRSRQASGQAYTGTSRQGGYVRRGTGNAQVTHER